MSTRILIVDDDAAAVSGLRTLLELDGYAPTGTTLPSEALELLKTETFDVVITDLEMPGVHGTDVVRAVRVHLPTVPIFIVTAYHDSPASARALDLGADKVFAKPLAYDDLRAEIDLSLEAAAQ